MDKEQEKWLKIAIIIAILLLLCVGFTMGYLWGDKSCIENPLLYGIKELNKDNNENYICSCYSYLGTKNIKWDADGLITENKMAYPILP